MIHNHLRHQSALKEAKNADILKINIFQINIDQYWNAFYYSRLPYWEISDVSVNGSMQSNYFGYKFTK